MHIPGFSEHKQKLNGIDIAWSEGGDGAPLLLLHGFPQTRALWAEIAPLLAKTHRVICPDLRGYGDSEKPAAVEAYRFRHMAQDQIALMAALGFARFAVAGHDRGGRVAHRLSLDAPDRVTALALMDIVPTHTLLDPLRRDVAQAYYHWFFLAQPEPLPETMISHDPDAFFLSCLFGWGAAQRDDFKADQLATYQMFWRKPDVIRGMCNDYRAALTYDFHDDADDLDARVTCPALILYGAVGAMGRTYDMREAWADKCKDFEVVGVPGGHFFPDTAPTETAKELLSFFAAAQGSD
ncbi:MAG: alpha/beta hydrolase [Pseudomonadota bacterium]